MLELSTDGYTPEPYTGSVNLLEEFLQECFDEEGNIIADRCSSFDEEGNPLTLTHISEILGTEDEDDEDENEDDEDNEDENE